MGGESENGKVKEAHTQEAAPHAESDTLLSACSCKWKSV